MGPVYGTHPPHHRGGRGTVPHPHHTTGGGGGRSHMGPVYGTHPIWGGRGGVAGPGAYINICIYTGQCTMQFRAEKYSTGNYEQIMNIISL